MAGHDGSVDLPDAVAGRLARLAADQRAAAAVDIAKADLTLAQANLDLVSADLGKAEIRSIYIGTPRTYTANKYLGAVEKCLALRANAIERYEQDARKAHSAAITVLRAQLKTLRAKHN